ncbi:unnamed protein product [Dibothriocephalus latus]|uniref:Uncharacterized protein n=1 Tax=Dibothriocephalus latus TaxID=60516 RepID=A0A3P7MZZ5_DIBLA|nr:unnamed protein product [Dibothriocephalus latus]
MILTSIYSDFVSEKNPSPQFTDSVFERPALWTATSFSSSEDFEDLQLGQPLPARLKDYYTPPATHVLPDPPSETNSSRLFMSSPASQVGVWR